MTTQRKIKINHDGIIRIATGRSRKDKNWINREIKWSELLDKLSQKVYTRESVEEYRSLPNSEQDGIKDVGGFVIINHIIAKGTIDEDVMKVLLKKEARQEDLLEAVNARLKKNNSWRVG